MTNDHKILAKAAKVAGIRGNINLFTRLLENSIPDSEEEQRLENTIQELKNELREAEKE